VSAICTVISLVTLGILVGVVGFPAIWSNFIATGIATVPGFELNRRWVWARGGQRSILKQAVPYCALSFVGLIVSTIAVHLASDATVHSTRLMHTAAVEAAEIGAYGALWLIQFVLCDQILFRHRADESKLENRHGKAARGSSMPGYGGWEDIVPAFRQEMRV
jgi:putative flippase GtrA